MLVKRIALSVCALLMFGSLAHADNIVETAQKAGKFNTLIAAAKAAGLVETLTGHDQLTVFAPTDEAFAKLPKGTIESLLKPENRSKLADILTFHVVPGRVFAKDAFQLDSATTANGQRIDIKRQNGELTFNGAGLVATDIKCDNGVIHIIDAVMIPETDRIPATAAKAKNFKTLLAAAKAAGLAGVLDSEGPFTVFAPSDEAFAKLPKGTLESLLKPENKQQLIDILKYHVVSGRLFSDQAIGKGQAKTLLGKNIKASVSGSGIRVNDSVLLATDIETANGVIHVIDSVLLPPSINREAAMTLLEETVARGAREYNDGNKKQCERLYRAAMARIIQNAGSDVPASAIDILQLSLSRSKKIEKHEDPCWVLRNGIDLAYFALEKSKHTSRVASH